LTYIHLDFSGVGGTAGSGKQVRGKYKEIFECI